MCVRAVLEIEAASRTMVGGVLALGETVTKYFHYFYIDSVAPLCDAKAGVVAGVAEYSARQLCFWKEHGRWPRERRVSRCRQSHAEPAHHPSASWASFPCSPQVPL